MAGGITSRTGVPQWGYARPHQLANPFSTTIRITITSMESIIPYQGGNLSLRIRDVALQDSTNSR